MKFLLVVLLLFTPLFAYETMVASDEAHYDGEVITLTGNVAVENTMGHLTAELAVLKKDPLNSSKIDFPWIELKHHVQLTFAEGGMLNCDSLFLDYTTLSGLIYGTPQVVYIDTMGEIYADRARVDYQEINGALEATKVTLYDNVKLINFGSAEKPASQYAIADEVYYFPQEQVMLLEGKANRVLFYDRAHDMQLSARSVRAQRDPHTQKETVQGIGDVRFVFGPEEFDKIKNRFQVK